MCHLRRSRPSRRSRPFKCSFSHPPSRVPPSLWHCKSIGEGARLPTTWPLILLIKKGQERRERREGQRGHKKTCLGNVPLASLPSLPSLPSLQVFFFPSPRRAYRRRCGIAKALGSGYGCRRRDVVVYRCRVAQPTGCTCLSDDEMSSLSVVWRKNLCIQRCDAAKMLFVRTA